MTSDRKIASNRRNAKLSTGPRSKAGREMSCRNARRHGLAIHVGADTTFSEDIEQLSRALCSSNGMLDSQHARSIAEATIDLRRIRRVRAHVFETFYVDGPITKERLTKLNAALATLDRYERRAFSRRKTIVASLRSTNA